MAAAVHPNVKVGQRFGVPCVKRDTGKVAFCPWQGDAVFELVDESVRTEWVLMPSAQSGPWPELDDRSLEG